VIRIAAIIAILGNAGLSALKIVIGLVANSGALLGDGIDSAADVLIGAMTLFVVRIMQKPADIKHPWGYGRAETVATAFLAFVLFFMGGQLIISSIAKLISGEQVAVPSQVALVATFVSIAGKMLLAFSQYVLGKRADSSMIIANAKNMAGDVMISGGVLVGLVLSALTGSAYPDTILAALIGCWIINTAIGIFLEANLELMDGSSGTEPYRVIVDAVNAVEGAGNPHRARMRRIAGFWEISFDIDVDPRSTVMEAHGIASQVEREIKRRVEHVFDIMIHVEPYGDDDAETFGLSQDEMGG
jgi:cation diffusion facilitator family transporter